VSSLGQTKDYNICICCFSSNIAALRSKRKYWLARNKNNVFEWIDMSIRGLLLQWASTVKCNSSCCSRTKRISSSSFHWNGTCSRYGVPGENYRPAASNYKMYIHNVHRSTISQSVKPLWYTSISCHKQLLLTLINTCNRRVVLFSSILFNTSFIYLHEWVSNCCLTLQGLNWLWDCRSMYIVYIHFIVTCGRSVVFSGYSGFHHQ
jgi:hypothetical protein